MTLEEFIDGILRCKGPARAIDQADLLYISCVDDAPVCCVTPTGVLKIQPVVKAVCLGCCCEVAMQADLKMLDQKLSVLMRSIQEAQALEPHAAYATYLATFTLFQGGYKILQGLLFAPFSCLLLDFSSLLVASVALAFLASVAFGFLRLVCSQPLSSRALGLLGLLRHILPTVDDHADGALDAAADDADSNVSDDQAAGVDDVVADVAVDRNDADVTISLLIIINNVIHGVINTSSFMISNIKISIISSINITIRIITNLTQTQARHAASDREQHQKR